MLPCTIDITHGGGPVSLPSAATTVIWQITAGATKPIALRRMQFLTNAIGSSQVPLDLRLVTYATGVSTNGSAMNPKPKSRGLTVTIAAAGYGATTGGTMGTTPTLVYSFPWNDVNPLDLLEGHPDLQDEFPAGTILALTQNNSSAGAGITYGGLVDFVEYG